MISEVYQFSASADLDDEIALWVARLDRGLTDDEEEELQQWLMVDDSRMDNLLEMAELWDCAGSLSRLAEMCPRQKNTNRISNKQLAIAASTVVLIGGALIAYFSQISVDSVPSVYVRSAPQKGTYQTAVGEQSAAVLTDGTQLFLNTDTALSVEYSVDQRRIDLNRGEVHVFVAKDEKRPLTVYANGKAVRAVGTAFNVERVGDDEIELLVTEGIVSVENHDSIDLAKTEVLGEREAVGVINVSAGYQLTISRDERVLIKVGRDELDTKLAWRAGNLIFKGESLEAVVNEINRYTAVKFEFADEDIKRIRVVGLFKTGDVTGLTTMLKNNFQLSVNHYEQEKRIVLEKLPFSE